jgi:ADP-heptose:LPS heptosyltransferase
VSARRILVVNFTRMGDLVQTSPLICGLRHHYPDAHIALLAAKAFSTVARLIPELDEVLEWDQDASVASLFNGQYNLDQALALHRSWSRRVRGDGWDLVINVTHSRDSAVLAHHLATGEVRGISIHADGSQHVEHHWSRYFFCVTGNRALNQFNLVDIYRLIGGKPGPGDRLSLKPGMDATRKISNHIDAFGGAGPLILVQPGASKDNRRWPVSAFAKAMHKIQASCPARFVIVGGPSERELAADLLNALDPEIPANTLAGDTSIEELTALCAMADLLVSNDTGTLHIAASQGTPSVSLFVATALPWETGPWMPGCLILHPTIECAPCSHHVNCPHVMCRDWIEPETVAGASLHLLESLGYGHGPTEDWCDTDKTRIWESFLSPSGLLDLKPLHATSADADDHLGRLYRILWEAEAGLITQAQTVSEWQGWVNRWSQDDCQLDTLLEQTAADLSAMRELAVAGMELVAQIEQELSGNAPDADRLSAWLEQIQRTDDRLFRMELSRPRLRPLGVMFRFDKESMRQDSEMTELSHRMKEIYLLLAKRCKRMIAHCAMAVTQKELEPA